MSGCSRAGDSCRVSLQPPYAALKMDQKCVSGARTMFLALNAHTRRVYSALNGVVLQQSFHSVMYS